MSFNITWQEYSPGIGPCSLIGYVGKWLCFRIEWGSTRSTDGDYVLKCMLPGIKEYIRVTSNDSGKKKADDILKYWLQKAEQNNV